jgi:hypothetical protein
MDAEGKLIQRFTSEAKDIPIEAGMNRFVWDMRYPGIEEVPGAIYFTHTVPYRPPLAPPGKYQVKLSVGDKITTQAWEWKKDPRVSTTEEEFQKQFGLQIEIRDKITQVNRLINQIRSVKERIRFFVELSKNSEKGGEVAVAGAKLEERILSVEEELTQRKNKNPGDPLRYPTKLDNKLLLLYCSLTAADAPPTDQAHQLFEELSAKADDLESKWSLIRLTDLAEFIQLVSEAGLSDIVTTTRKRPDGIHVFHKNRRSGRATER